MRSFLNNQDPDSILGMADFHFETFDFGMFCIPDFHILPSAALQRPLGQWQSTRSEQTGSRSSHASPCEAAHCCRAAYLTGENGAGVQQRMQQCGS